jgi:hypothetical protein
MSDELRDAFEAYRKSHERVEPERERRQREARLLFAQREAAERARRAPVAKPTQLRPFDKAEVLRIEGYVVDPKKRRGYTRSYPWQS